MSLALRRFELLSLALPFRFAFRHALAERRSVDCVLLRVTGTDGVTGMGECVPRDYVTGETPASVREALERHLVPPLRGAVFETFDAVVAALSDLGRGLARGHHAAFCALELAVLDAAGRAFGRSAGDVLGPVLHDEVAYSGIISADDIDAVSGAARMQAAAGVDAVKVKVGLGRDRDLEVLSTVRAILPASVRLRVDANAAWTADEAVEMIGAMSVFELESVEQPCPAGDLDGMAAVQARAGVPLVADESLVDEGDAARLIERRACRIFNLRVSKNGGLLRTRRLHAMAAAAGLRCQLGAQVGETGFLSAAGRHVATRLPGFVNFEGSYGRILLEEDVTKPDVTVGPGGRAPALRGPGLGVDPDAEALGRRLVAEQEI